MLLALAASVAACKSDGPDEPEKGNTEPIKCSWTANPAENATTEDEVTFTADITGGKAPYTCTWTINSKSGAETLSSTESVVKYVFPAVGTYSIRLDVSDSEGNKAAKSYTQVYTVQAPKVEDKGDIKVEWYVDFADEGGGVRGSAPAVDDAGNIYIATSVNGGGRLRKVSPDGKTLSDVALESAPGNTCGSPSIDKDGNVIVFGGSGAGGSMLKYTSSLSKVWRGEFIGYKNGWAVSNANPKLWYGAPVIAGDYVLVGNAGTTGLVGAVALSDGTRVSYVTNEAGTGGPQGGCRQSPAVSNDGYVWQVCAGNGILGVQLSDITKAGIVHYDWLASQGSDGSLFTSGSDRPAMAVVNVGGENYAAGVNTPENSCTQVLLIDRKNGKSKGFAINSTNTSIENKVSQDQGAAVIGNDNEIIVNLKAGNGEDGGIVAVDPSTMTLAWEFRLAESVSSGAAVTKEGNVVFGTDAGNFYIIRPGKASAKVELIAKANINEILTAAGMPVANEEMFKVKMWSQVTIADDGKIYIGFQRSDSTTSSGLLCLSTSACTGVGTSGWPMFGVDRKHTGVQK